MHLDVPGAVFFYLVFLSISSQVSREFLSNFLLAVLIWRRQRVVPDPVNMIRWGYAMFSLRSESLGARWRQCQSVHSKFSISTWLVSSTDLTTTLPWMRHACNQPQGIPTSIFSIWATEIMLLWEILLLQHADRHQVTREATLTSLTATDTISLPGVRSKNTPVTFPNIMLRISQTPGTQSSSDRIMVSAIGADDDVTFRLAH